MTGGNNTQGRRILSRNEKRRKRTKVFFMFALILIAVLFLVFMYLKFFNIRKIELIGIENSAYTSEEILEFIGIGEGDNLINVRSGALEDKLERQFAYVKEAKIIKDFPTTLKIEFEMHEAAMSVVLGDDIFLLSSKGKVLGSISADEGVPEGVCALVTPFIVECIQGETIVFEKEEYSKILLDIYSEFEKKELAVHLTELDITDKFNISAVLDSRFDIIFGTYEDSEAKVELLSAVVSGDLWIDSSGIIDISDSREAAVRLTGSAAN